MIRIKEDEGLLTLSKRLGFKLYNRQQLSVEKLRILLQSSINNQIHIQSDLVASQKTYEEHSWLEAMEKWPLKENEVVVVSPSFGMAELLMVREAFKRPVMILLYTGLVLAACFHAFNGLWTFMITWGVTLTSRSQQLMRTFATGLMVLVAFLGLAAIWGTYWINLRY